MSLSAIISDAHRKRAFGIASVVMIAGLALTGCSSKEAVPVTTNNPASSLAVKVSSLEVLDSTPVINRAGHTVCTNLIKGGSTQEAMAGVAKTIHFSKGVSDVAFSQYQFVKISRATFCKNAAFTKIGKYEGAVTSSTKPSSPAEPSPSDSIDGVVPVPTFGK
jgi:hypothetical protein